MIHESEWHYCSLIQSPTPSRNSVIVLVSCCRAMHKFWILELNVVWQRRRFLRWGSSPIWSCRMVVMTRAQSCWSPSMREKTPGCLCPTSDWKALFHPSHILLVRSPPRRDTSCTFQTTGGKVGGRRRTRRDWTIWIGCGNLDTAKVATDISLIEIPDQFIKPIGRSVLEVLHSG